MPCAAVAACTALFPPVPMPSATGVMQDVEQAPYGEHPSIWGRIWPGALVIWSVSGLFVDPDVRGRDDGGGPCLRLCGVPAAEPVPRPEQKSVRPARRARQTGQVLSRKARLHRLPFWAGGVSSGRGMTHGRCGGREFNVKEWREPWGMGPPPPPPPPPWRRPTDVGESASATTVMSRARRCGRRSSWTAGPPAPGCTVLCAGYPRTSGRSAPGWCPETSEFHGGPYRALVCTSWQGHRLPWRQCSIFEVDCHRPTLRVAWLYEQFFL